MEHDKNEQLAGIRGKLKNGHDEDTASTAVDYLEEERRQLVQNEIRLGNAKVQRERAAVYQSVAMAVFTGLSAIAVGLTMWRGSQPIPNAAVARVKSE